MLLATQTDVLGKRYSDFDAVKIIADAGFDALDYSMFRMSEDNFILNTDEFRPYVLELLETAKRNNIIFTQGHAPFSFSHDTGEDEFVRINKERVSRSIEIASLLGIKVLVVHPIHFRNYYENKESIFEQNVNYYKSLIPYCEKYGVKIACENMWQRSAEKKNIVDSICSDPYEFRDMIDAVGSEFLTGCLDLGHCVLTSRDTASCIKIIGNEKLGALHVHDNDLFSDLHTLPGFGKMDWDSITKALADIDYKGDFTFEADNFFIPFRDREGAVKAADVMHYKGRELIRKIEDAKIAKY